MFRIGFAAALAGAVAILGACGGGGPTTQAPPTPAPPAPIPDGPVAGESLYLEERGYCGTTANTDPCPIPESRPPIPEFNSVAVPVPFSNVEKAFFGPDGRPYSAFTFNDPVSKNGGVMVSISDHLTGGNFGSSSDRRFEAIAYRGILSHSAMLFQSRAYEDLSSTVVFAPWFKNQTAVSIGWSSANRPSAARSATWNGFAVAHANAYLDQFGGSAEGYNRQQGPVGIGLVEGHVKIEIPNMDDPRNPVFNIEFGNWIFSPLSGIRHGVPNFSQTGPKFENVSLSEPEKGRFLFSLGPDTDKLSAEFKAAGWLSSAPFSLQARFYGPNNQEAGGVFHFPFRSRPYGHVVRSLIGGFLAKCKGTDCPAN